MRDTTKLAPFQNQSESFTAFRDDHSYYVDKTDVITYLIESGHKICVCTRPRRFGKTLMLRTLQTFFEYRLDKDGNPIDNRRYFDGLKVMDSGENVLRHFGQYPVISMSLKDVSGDTYESIVAALQKSVYDACQPHLSLLLNHPALLDEEKEQFRRYATKRASDKELKSFLGDMCVWLNRITSRKVVILLDEYDVPLQQAAIYDIHHPKSELFERTVRLIGKFISTGFKSNDNLAVGIIAGCMRVAKESIFTGMNNPGVITVLDRIPNEFWGFTPKEVEDMLAYYGLSDQMDALKNWYDGYYYSNREVYNPWSLLNAIRGLVEGYGDDAIKPYWGLTSGNDIIDDMIERNPQHREALGRMMDGGTMTVPVFENLSYRDLQQNPEAIWSFLLYTGYLKSLRSFKNERNQLQAVVTIPNEEVRTLMDASMRKWWETIQIKAFNTKPLATALMTGDIDTIEREFRFALKGSLSVFDYNEAFYHGMTVGLLRTVAEVHSNDEYGEGRPDVVTVIGDKGIVLELKCVTPKALKNAGIADNERAKIKSMMQTKLDEAVRQIQNNEYAEAVLDDEPAAREVLAYAVCFCRKWCMVRAIEQ